MGEEVVRRYITGEEKVSIKQRILATRRDIAHFLYKVKFIDKRIFLAIGFFIVIVLLCIAMFPFFSDSFSTNEQEEAPADDFFNEGSLSGNPVEDIIEEEPKTQENNNVETGSEQIEQGSFDDISNEIRTRLEVGGKIEFEINSVNHEMTLNKINNGYVDVIIKSDPIFAALVEKRPKKIDLEKDGSYDIIIKHSSVGILKDSKDSL